MAAVCALFASCMGDSYAGIDEDAPAPYGNNELTETNVVSIAKLKEKFANYIATDYRNGVSYAQVKEDMQIKGVVTSSDAQGNIYNEIALQDETGAIIIAVAQSGIYGSLPVGTQVLVNLKDLYVGNYGKQAEIGVPTTNKNNATYVGRMSRATWDSHYKILGKVSNVEPAEFAVGSNPTKWDINTDGGKLGIIRNVSFKSNDKGVDGTFANPNGGAGSVSWTLNEQDSKSVIVYNSNYADFANAKIPTGKVDITGIFKRFNNQWEIIIRSLDDIQPAQPVDPLNGLDGTGKGTKDDPFDVVRALSLANSGKADATDYYIKGIISQIDEISTQYGNATYYISNDGKTDKQLMVFRGKFINGENFTSADQLRLGMQVLIIGKLKLYNGTPEVDKNNWIIEIK